MYVWTVWWEVLPVRFVGNLRGLEHLEQFSGWRKSVKTKVGFCWFATVWS
jgi:hypothetical protein